MPRILVIDDEANIRTTVRLALTSANHEVKTAADGQEGLDLYGDGRYWDAVLLDQRMPGLEGLEVLRRIRQRRDTAVVIMITAFGTVDLAVDAMRAGATDFLRKPFTVEILRGAVAAALAPPEPAAGAGEGQITYGLSTLNGFRVQSCPADLIIESGEVRLTLRILAPDGSWGATTVSLPPPVAETIREHIAPRRPPGGARFWQAVCEEVAANYVWQIGELPPADGLVVHELNAGLRRWIDAVVTNSE